MPRQPSATSAIGMWDSTHPNQQRNAQYGQRWPVMPPDWADGYVSRTNYLASGDVNPYLTGINDWGPMGIIQNYYQALSIRCTSHDWELKGWGHGNATSTGGLIYYDFKLWESQYVNDVATEVSAYNALATAMWVPAQGTPCGQNIINTGAYGGANYRLTQNTWYTMGVGYNQASSQSWHAYPSFFGSWSGYGTPQASVTMTSTGTNVGGSTTITSDWEFATVLGISTSSAPWISNWGTTSVDNGVFMTNHVQVYQ